jgi:hypothetical protein
MRRGNREERSLPTTKDRPTSSESIPACADSIYSGKRESRLVSFGVGLLDFKSGASAELHTDRRSTASGLWSLGQRQELSLLAFHRHFAAFSAL